MKRHVVVTINAEFSVQWHRDISRAMRRQRAAHYVLAARFLSIITTLGSGGNRTLAIGLAARITSRNTRTPRPAFGRVRTEPAVASSRSGAKRALYEGRRAGLVANRREPARTSSAIGLLVALAAAQALAAAALATHRPAARAAAAGAALIAVAWGAWQVLATGYATWFDIALLLVGVVELLFVAGCTPRDAGEPARDRWRRRRAAEARD